MRHALSEDARIADGQNAKRRDGAGRTGRKAACAAPSGRLKRKGFCHVLFPALGRSGANSPHTALRSVTIEREDGRFEPAPQV
jgi:hypothetical protein